MTSLRMLRGGWFLRKKKKALERDLKKIFFDPGLEQTPLFYLLLRNGELRFQCLTLLFPGLLLLLQAADRAL